MRKIIVSDTTAITHLAKINLLHVLQALYEEILIPEAVFQELSRVNRAQAGAQQVLQANWIKVVPVKNVNLVALLREELDPGEAEAIALAIEKKADVLIIDEATGRTIAKKLVTKIIGMAGILVEAKRAGILISIEPHLVALINTGFRMSDTIFDQALNLAGETRIQSKIKK